MLTKTVDSKGRITLGEKFANQQVIIEQVDETEVRVTLAELEADPHPALARMRVAGPAAWVPALGAWMVTGYHAAVSVLRDARTFTVDDPRFSTAKVVGPSMLSLDGAQHARHDLDGEGEAVQECREAADHYLLLRFPLQPEVETPHLKHGAVLPTDEAHDVILDGFQAKVRGLDAGLSGHNLSSCQAILGASSSQATASPPSGSGSRGCQTLSFGTAA